MPNGRSVVEQDSGASGGRKRAWIAAALTLLLVAVVLVAIMPTQDWLRQREDRSEAIAERDGVKAELEKVKREQELLKTDAELERRAKEDLGMVRPGEEAYNILPAPVDPIGLPQGWPFTGVERVFGAS